MVKGKYRVNKGFVFGNHVIIVTDEYGNQIWFNVSEESKKIYFDFHKKKYVPLTEQEIETLSK